MTADVDSLLSTIQFVGMAAFHTRISDPVIGGTYMTVCRPPSSSHLVLLLLAIKYLYKSRRNLAKVFCAQR
jgi:hypothetical protein